jgi:hypothetical protein
MVMIFLVVDIEHFLVLEVPITPPLVPYLLWYIFTIKILLKSLKNGIGPTLSRSDSWELLNSFRKKGFLQIFLCFCEMRKQCELAKCSYHILKLTYSSKFQRCVHDRASTNLAFRSGQTNSQRSPCTAAAARSITLLCKQKSRPVFPNTELYCTDFLLRIFAAYLPLVSILSTSVATSRCPSSASPSAAAVASELVPAPACIVHADSRAVTAAARIISRFLWLRMFAALAGITRASSTRSHAST